MHHLWLHPLCEFSFMLCKTAASKNLVCNISFLFCAVASFATELLAHGGWIELSQDWMSMGKLQI